MNMSEEQKDALWETLGRSPSRRAPDRFVADVLRAVRRREPVEEALPGWLAWLLPGAAAAVVAVVLGMAGFYGTSVEPGEGELALEEMIGIEQLIASGSESAWADLEGSGMAGRDTLTQ